ncbi:MAG: hypothetical protein U0869_04765 [Chloroflexota bacterium]
MHIDAQVQGVAFVDDHHVLVAPDGGDLLQMTIDSAELLGPVRSAPSRGFTPTECTTYGLDPWSHPRRAQVRGSWSGPAAGRATLGSTMRAWRIERPGGGGQALSEGTST